MLLTALYPLERINKRLSKINLRKNEKLDQDVVPYEIKPIVEKLTFL